MPSHILDDTPDADPEALVTESAPQEAAPAQGDDSLDALLAEYSNSTAGANSYDPTPDLLAAERQLTAQQAKLQTHAQQLAHAEAAAKAERDIAEAVNDIRGDLDKTTFPDELVAAWLDAKARKDQRLQQLFLNREENPRALQIAVKHMAKEFQKTMNQRPDPEAMADKEAVAAAVKGASSRAPASEAPNLGRLSDAELRNHVRANHGFDPGF